MFHMYEFATAVIALSRRLVAATTILFLLATVPVLAETLVFHASASGKRTLDQGEGGGNPFASALIEVLASPSLKLIDLLGSIEQLTATKSRGFQSADVPASVVQGNFLLSPRQKSERRIALVVVVSDYARSGGAQSLPGAKYDAERIASALKRVGFDTEIALDQTLPAMRKSLAAFAARSSEHDVAVVYTTGHGVEVGGTVFLVPGDYPIRERNAALSSRALPLPEISQSARAKTINLIFYGGCRDNPFDE